MREYSDNVSSEFAELYTRAASGDKIKIYIQTPRNIEYTIEGNVAGIHLCSLMIKNSVLDLSNVKDENLKAFYKKMEEGTAHIPLGDYIKNYEFLTGEKFTIEQQEQERKNYYKVKGKNSTYLDEIF